MFLRFIVNTSLIQLTSYFYGGDIGPGVMKRVYYTMVWGDIEPVSRGQRLTTF
jgi:hypothetical protein